MKELSENMSIDSNGVLRLNTRITPIDDPICHWYEDKAVEGFESFRTVRELTNLLTSKNPMIGLINCKLCYF